MKRALLNLLRTAMLLKHFLILFLLTLVRLYDCVCNTIIALVKQFLLRSSLINLPWKNFPGFYRHALISTLLLFAVTLNLRAEGTKQLEPATPNAANGYCELSLFAGGMTPNGYRIPFATVGCTANYRLNVHISDPTTEVVYFGFKQKGNGSLFYRWIAPDGSVVMPYSLVTQPTAGNPGYIATWNQSVAGPIIGALNPGGYNPLSFIPSIPGDYYLEFAADAAGNTAAWATNPATIEFFDVSVYQGNTVKEGRLWSKAWQFCDVSGGQSPETNFFVYSNDSIVTKLNINRWNGGYYIFYCNEWGVVNTGNWYTDRQSLAAWPGDLPEYKEFLNDPDNIVYPTGSFGTICDVQTISKCDGSVEFQVKVNKAGKIDMSIDIAPLGVDNGEDVKINANVTGSPGCTTWETINWDGKNGLGQLLANGAATNVEIKYLNGLTHMPIYDIETNKYGLMVDLVRPTPPIGGSKLDIYWDDTQVPQAPNPKTNFTGCIYANAANACHNWPTNNQGNLVMYNSWWYYLADLKNTNPIISRLPATPGTPSGQTIVCEGQTNLVYTVPPIQFATSYVWTLPDGSVKTTLINTISLDFLTPSSGGTLTVHGENANCNGNESPPLLITVNPTPVVSANQSSPTICSGGITSIVISSSAVNSTFTWTASAPASISGFSNGSGNTVAQTLTNNSNAPHDVTYIITPVASGCVGAPVTVIQTIQPANTISSLPLTQTICSGSTFTMNLTATLPGTNFTWTVSGTGITGFSNGSGNVISQTLTNTTAAPSNATYLVSGTINGCTTNTTTYTVTVKNLPTQFSLAGGGEYCSGGSGVLVGLTSSQLGVSYQLFNNAVPAGAQVSGTGSPINFGNQTLAGTYNVTGTRVSDACSSDMGNSVTVAINPNPVVNAGADFTIPHGISTTLNSSVSGGTSPFKYSWSPAGSLATGSNTLAPHTTNIYSSTTFTLVVTDTKGCTSNDQVTVNLSGSALSVAVSASTLQICNDGSQLQLFSNASGGFGVYTYSWTKFPAGNPVWNSTQQNPWVSPNTTTLYTVVVNDGYNTATASVQITVNDLPTQFLLSGGGEYCSGGSGVPVGLTNSQAGVSYQLFNNAVPVGAQVSGTGSPISFGNQTVAGTYTVTGTRIANACSSDMGNNVAVVINPIPVVNAGADFTIPHGISTTLNGTVSGGTSPFNYSWSPAGSIATGSNTLAPHTTNIYSATTFTFLVTDTKGCTRNDQVTVSLSGSALSVAVSASTLQICNDGSQLQLFSNASGGSGIYSYSWTKFPAGNPVWSSTQQNPRVSPNTTTLYTVVVNDGYNTATAFVQIAVNPLPVKYNMMGGGTSCLSGSGVPVGLSGSQANTAYQLFQDGVAVGPIVNGTGNQINFGNYTTSGAFTVVATNLTTGCVNTMAGTAKIIVNPLPKIYQMDPLGQQCPGTIIRLNGSELGVNYYLLLNGTTVASISGNGLVGFLDFGPRTVTGTYTVLAVNMMTGCSAMMNGSTFISIAPAIFNVLPAGILCPGQMISLSGSEVGVSYQLRWNTTFDVGSPVPGTGSLINMGVGNQPGVYTIIGINDITRCVTYMNDSATLYPNPILYTIIPDGPACEGDEISLNGSQIGVDYILLLDNAIHVDTIHGTGSTLSFGAQNTAGNYSIIAVIQNSYCITQMNGVAIFRDAPVKYDLVPAGIICIGNSIGLATSQVGVSYQLLYNGNINMGPTVSGTGSAITFGDQSLVGKYTVKAVNDISGCNSMMTGIVNLVPLPVVYQVAPAGNHCAGTNITLDGSELNFNYRLILNGSVNIDTLAGTGVALDFGPQMTAGNYTVIAFSSNTFCLTSMSGTSIIDPRPILYNLNPAGVACVGDVLGLDNSEPGAFYQLRREGTINVGSQVAGTGSAISFGIQIIPGVYSVEATGSNGCHAIMIDSVTVHALPVFYTILPAGTHCPGTTIKLNGSETGINYILYRDGIYAIDTIAGTGGILDFGEPRIAGTYTVLAYSTAALCQSVMNGSTTILSGPTAFNITPAGINCIGSAIGLDNSETGVIYQLRRDGITNVGTAVVGTGSAISFGILNIPGTYTVIATNTVNGCGNNMNGVAVLKPLPLNYTLTLQGKQCAGISIILNGSQIGTDYVLVRDNTFNIDTIAGNGTLIDFGPQFVTGTYTVVAIAGATTCQTLMNGSTQIMALPSAFNITPAGINCATANVGLDGSEIGTTYTLYYNSAVSGTPVSGTGNAINFGIQSQNGIYKVIAVNNISGCNALMTDSIILEPLPVVYSATPSGNHCAGTSIGLNGSDKNINYILVLNGSINLDTVPGTGNAIDFGAQITGGNYSIIAYNTATFCRRLMNSNSVIIADPIDFKMTPAGVSCAGSNLGIEASQAGITYQLYWNGGVDIGSPVAGTGSAINFGIQNLPGTYYVVATNSLGCYITMSNKVDANPLPNAFNLVPSGTQCQGTSLGLDGSEINAKYILVHNGNVMLDTISGNGGTITFGPQLTSGNYSVIAFNTSTHCQSTMIGSSTILPQSAPAIFSVTPAGIGCGSVTIGLDDSEIATFYQLRLNGSSNVGTPVSGTGSPISFGLQTAEGVYTVISTNSNGCTTNALFDVTIGQLPVADFSYTGGDCDSVMNFADITTGAKIVRRIWTFGDGKSKIIDAPDKTDFSHIYSTPGSYQVTLITENETGCSDTITKTVLRKPCIAAVFKVSDEVICQKRKMKFTESSTCQAPIASWTWYFGDNTSARFTNPQPFIEHTYAVSGIYTVKMVVATQMVGGLVTDTASSQVAVKPAATASYKWQDVCVGNKTLFDNQTQDNNTVIKSYAWNFGDPTTLTDTTSAKNAEYKYDLNGEYEVKLVVTNTLGCTDTIINKVNIFKGPAANFIWNNNCASRPVNFTDQSQATSSAIVNWNWQFSSNGEVLDKSTQQNCTYNFVHAGTYDADMKVIDKNGCATTINKQVIISPNPVAAFTIVENYDNVQGQVMLSNGSIDGTNNYWSFGNGETSYGSNPVVTFTDEGHYEIQLLTWNDQNCTDTISMSYDLMYKGLFVPNAFNPGHRNSEVAVFKPKGMNLKSYQIEIYDSWGNLLWKSDKLDDGGSPLEGWDGTFQGALLQQDVYVWKIVAQYKDDQIWDGLNIGDNKNMPLTKSGTVTLLR